MAERHETLLCVGDACALGHLWHSSVSLRQKTRDRRCASRRDRLPKTGFNTTRPVFMPLFRAILSICFALLFWPATNSCLIASSFPKLMAPACECGTNHEENDSLPCSTKDCSPCSTLENGVNLAALQQPAVPPTVVTVADSLVEFLERFARLESEALLEPPPVPPPIPPPVWRHDVTTAQPVRGPSFAV